MATPYQQKLKNPQWQKTRLKVFERDNYRCVLCYSTEKELHAHHTVYNGDIYNDEDIITVCEGCHKRVEAVIKAIRKSINHEIYLRYFESLLKFLEKGGESAGSLASIVSAPEAARLIITMENIRFHAYSDGYDDGRVREKEATQ